jgi:GT2 family glycosyltransferase
VPDETSPPSDRLETAGPTPLVSVLLPVHNGGAFVGAALDSALGQTYQHTEVIVVDDGSRDNTRAMVDARARQDSRVVVIGQTNRGVAAARNRALAAARGEFVAPLDADDVWDPTKIERQVERLRLAGPGSGMAYCWWVWIDAQGGILDCSPRWRIEGHASETLLQVNYTGCASVPLYRRDVLERVGGYDEAMPATGCEDWDVALKVAEVSEVAVVPAVLVAYRRRRGSLSSSTDRMWRAHESVIDGVRRRRPGTSGASVRRAHDQFALYLAGVSFWSGAYGRALGWGLNAWRSSTALRVAPHLARVFLAPWRRRPHREPIRPGTCFAAWDMPQPLIPYDRIHARQLKRGLET